MSDSDLGAMVYDLDTGNAVDSFPYTAEELERRVRELRGNPVVTLYPNPFGARLSPQPGDTE